MCDLGPSILESSLCFRQEPDGCSPACHSFICKTRLALHVYFIVNNSNNPVKDNDDKRSCTHRACRMGDFSSGKRLLDKLMDKVAPSSPGFQVCLNFLHMGADQVQDISTTVQSVKGRSRDEKNHKRHQDELQSKEEGVLEGLKRGGELRCRWLPVVRA